MLIIAWLKMGLYMNKTAIEQGVTAHVCRVLSVKSLNPLSSINQGTFEIELQSIEAAALSFQAGQYLELELELALEQALGQGVNKDSQTHALSYTIASRFNKEQPNCLKLIIQKNSAFSGKVVDRLKELSHNQDKVNITLAMGRAFLQTDLDLPHLLVAAGSGISKIKCITEEILQKNPDANVNIYWSNRNADDFFLLNEFNDWAAQYKNLQFTPILESTADNWFGPSGFIYQVIQKDFSDLTNMQTYLCGSPQMVYGTIDQLTPLGLQEENCYSDVFEFAPRDERVAV